MRALILMLVLAASPVATAQNAGFQPGYGFWVGDARGAASLHTAVQPRYACETTFDDDDPCRLNGFGLRRARLRLGAVVPDPSLELAVQADLADLDQPLEEAWALFRPWPAIRLTAGRTRIPLTREGLYAEERLPLSEVSPLTARLHPPRDLGLSVGARVGPLDAVLGAWNGAPETFSNDNVDLLYAARFQVDVLGAAASAPGEALADGRPHLSIGVGAMYDLPRSGEDGAGAAANARVTAGTVDVALRLGPASIDLGGGWLETDRGALEQAEDLVRQIGASASLTWAFAEPRVVPAARLTLMDDEPAEGEDAGAWELALGASWRTGASDLLTILFEGALSQREDEEEVFRGVAELRIVL